MDGPVIKAMILFVKMNRCKWEFDKDRIKSFL